MRKAEHQGVWVVAAVVVAVLFAFASWALLGRFGRGIEPSATAPEPNVSEVTEAGLDGYNLLLVTLDTLRADHLGAYGYDGVETPAIDRLAAEGVRFERVTTTVPVTLPAHASIMTGQNPFAHGVRNNASFFLRDEATTLAESLRAAGYATGGFIGAVVLDAQFGIGQGFDVYPGLDAEQGTEADLGGERRGGAVVDQAIDWMQVQSEPFFAWVHMYDPHDPYDAPEPYGSRFADRPYDGEVAYVDAMVGRLRAALEASGRADNTLIVVTSDHGEGLGDHGEQGHSYFIYDSTVRVPLIFWTPGAIPEGVVVEGEASVIDIMPTILSLLAIDASDPGDASATAEAGAASRVAAAAPDGVDLSDRFADPGTAGSIAYAESLIPYLDFGWSELRALVDGHYKYIEAPEPELYDLAADPGETDNLVDVEVDRAERMSAALGELVAGDDVTEAAGQVIDPDSIERLRSLGYLGGGGGARDRRDIDPKDMIEVYETFVDGLVESIDAIADDRFGDANEILAVLDELIPDQYIVYYYFGQLAQAAGDLATAVQVLERALELEPTYLPTYTELANVLHASGNTAGAQELIAEAVLLFPGNFSLRLLSGALYHDAGQLARALVAYREAERLRPDHPGLLDRFGHLYLLQRQPSEAAAVLQRLTQVSPDDAAAWAQLAFALAQTGDADGAQRAIRQALALDPDDPTVRQIMSQLR